MLDANKSQIDRMILAATLYYKEKLSQQEIAKRLGVSRPWVSKLLTKAEELGIVKIEIQSPITGNAFYQEQLRIMYPDTEIRVIDVPDEGEDYLSIAATNYFVSKLQPKDVVGIGFGSAVTRFVNQMMTLKFPETSTVPLAGSFGTTFEVLPNYNSIKLAEKLGGTANVLHIPAVCSSVEEYNTLIQHEDARKVLDMAVHADLWIVGIGTFSTSFLTKHSIFSKEEQQSLQESGAVGDVILQFMDENGDPIKAPLTEYLIHPDIYETRKHSAHIIAIVQGDDKGPIIKAVLKRKLVDVLFVDSETAKTLL